MLRASFVFGFASLFSCFIAPFALAAERPNIVVIICDDLGYGDIGCYGHPVIKTPHLDQMADDGARFTDFYSTAPVCSPSRVGLLTGRSPNRAGVYDWIPPSNSKLRPDAREQVHMRKEEVTIAHLLQSAGYATCMAGKWHCNGAFNSARQPQPSDAGFEHWFGTQNNASPSHENPTNYVRNGKPVGPLKGFSCQIVADEGVSWLGDHLKENPEQPFFMYLAFHEPHEPIASPQVLVEKYQPEARNEDEAQYFANVANVDSAVGKILTALSELKQADNTLVLFTSDNGPETLKRYSRAKRSYGRPTPLRGMKLWTTDAGFRVAGIMRWPANIEPGQTVSTPVSALDLLPTFCNLAKAELPKDIKLDGINCEPAMNGKELKRESPLFWCYYNATNEQRVAMRDGEWKIIAKLNGGKFPIMQNVNSNNVEMVRAAKVTDIELYHIANDVDESENLAKQKPETAAKYAKLMQERYEELTANSHFWQVKQ